MRGFLDENGILNIERLAGKFTQQRCPHAQNNGCGDICPLFQVSIPQTSGNAVVRLGCSTRTDLVFVEFADKRISTQMIMPQATTPGQPTIVAGQLMMPVVQNG